MSQIIALFGGSFNPPTRKHREIGQVVLAQLPVDAVWYLVAPQNPLKSTKDMARFEDRVAMMRLNLANDRQFVVQDIEAAYARELGVTAIHSADALRLMKRDYPDTRFLWVVGADNFTTMHLWGDYQYITKNVPIIVVPRAGFDRNALMECPLAKHLAVLRKAEDAVRYNGWFLLNAKLSDINATACRKQLRAQRWPIVMRPSVTRYVFSHCLYERNVL